MRWLTKVVFYWPSGGSAVFYKPVGVTTEIKSGYLLKSPPTKQFRSEVTERPLRMLQWIDWYIDILMIDTLTRAEIMEEEIFCALQSGRTWLSAQVLQEPRGEGQSDRRDWPAAVGPQPSLYTLHWINQHRRNKQGDAAEEFWLWTLSLFSISQMCVSPVDNHRWGWIQKTFRCSDSCVLCIRTADRDFFLIGQDRSVSINQSASCSTAP